jgi:hypothetical protein
MGESDVHIAWLKDSASIEQVNVDPFGIAMFSFTSDVCIQSTDANLWVCLVTDGVNHLGSKVLNRSLNIQRRFKSLKQAMSIIWYKECMKDLVWCGLNCM